MALRIPRKPGRCHSSVLSALLRLLNSAVRAKSHPPPVVLLKPCGVSVRCLDLPLDLSWRTLRHRMPSTNGKLVRGLKVTAWTSQDRRSPGACAPYRRSSLCRPRFRYPHRVTVMFGPMVLVQDEASRRGPYAMVRSAEISRCMPRRFIIWVFRAVARPMTIRDPPPGFPPGIARAILLR